MQQQPNEASEFLSMDPLAALNLQPVALRGGGGGSFNNRDPMMDEATMLAMGKVAAGLPFYGGTTKVPEPMGYMGGTTGVPYNYMNGTEEVPGQRTGQDTVPAMLSPGEAVIPASAAQDPANQGAIEGMVEEGRADQGMAGQILQSLGLPMDPQLIAMIEDMLAQGVPPETIVQQLQERMNQSQGGQEMPSDMPQQAPMAAQQAPMAAQQAPMQSMEQGMPMPQGMYGGTSHVQAPLSGKKQREQQKFDSDEYRKDAAFQSDQQRKNESHMRSMSGE